MIYPQRIGFNSQLFVLIRYLITLLVILLWLPSTLQAEIVTIWGEGKHIMGDNDTKDDARKLALLRAKTMCLEKAGTYLESETTVKDLKLAKDEIKAYTAGIVKIKVVDEQVSLIGESPCVRVKVKADIDTSQLEERIKQLRKDERILDDYKKIQAENKRLTKQVAELQKQLGQAKGKEQIDKIKAARKYAFDGLTAVDWFNKALDEATSSHPNWDLVIKWNKKAIEIEPDLVEAHYNLGTAYYSKGLYDKAILNSKRAIELKPNYAEAHYNLGAACFKKGLVDEAIASYKKAIELKPDFAQAYCNLGAAYYSKGLYDKAIVSYKKAINLKPNYAEAHGNLGIAYGKKELYDEAIASFKKAIEIEPDLADAHCNLGMTYFFGKGLKYSAANHYYKAGLLYLERGNKEGALMAYDFLRECMPNSELTSKLHRKLYPKRSYETTDATKRTHTKGQAVAALCIWCGGATAYIAKRKKKSGWKWGLLGFFVFGPALYMLIVVIIAALGGLLS